MLGVYLFILFWLVLGLGVFFLAIRGGRGARPGDEPSGIRGFATTVFVIVYGGFGLALPIVLLAGNHANAGTSWDGVHLNADDRNGLALFGQHCAYCHTLAAANAVGKVGPNLDILQPSKTLVLNTVQNGLNIGNGVMPPDIVVGKQAVDVSDFVSKVAGK